MIFVAGLSMLGSTTMFIQSADYKPLTKSKEVIKYLCNNRCAQRSLWLTSSCGFVLFLSSIVAFSANVIQFHQLHDSPAESSILYIHWYVWTIQVGSFLLRLPSAH